MTRDYAERVAIAALAFLARDDIAMRSFFQQSGIEPTAMRSMTPAEIYAGVMGYLMEAEETLLVFARSVRLAPEDIGLAANRLSA